MEQVPEEILLEILQHVTNKEVMRCARLNKKFNAMISRNWTKLPRAKRIVTVQVQKETDGRTYYAIVCGHKGLEWHAREILIHSDEICTIGNEKSHSFHVKHALYCYLDSETCPRDQPKSTSTLKIADQNKAIRGVIGFIGKRFIIRRLLIKDKSVRPSLTDEETMAWYAERRRNVDQLEDLVVEELLRNKAKVETLELLYSTPIPMPKLWKLRDQLRIKGLWLIGGLWSYEKIDEIVKNLGDLSLRLERISRDHILEVIENWKRGTQKDVCYNFFEVDMHWFESVKDKVVQCTSIGQILRFKRDTDNRELYCKIYHYDDDGNPVRNLPYIIMRDKEPAKDIEEFDDFIECIDQYDSEWSVSKYIGLYDPYDFDEFEEYFTDYYDEEMDEQA